MYYIVHIGPTTARCRPNGQTSTDCAGYSQCENDVSCSASLFRNATYKHDVASMYNNQIVIRINPAFLILERGLKYTVRRRHAVVKGPQPLNWTRKSSSEQL